MITVVFCFPKTAVELPSVPSIHLALLFQDGWKALKGVLFFFRQRTNHLITLGSRGVVVVDVRFDSRTSSTPIAPLSFHTRSLAGGGRW